ncbi:hypothetical protein C9J48_06220 [Photobacterium profundum]|uniref:Uncharacterized protein n=1 Tax=Photobacterium profundum 3TCK TaxID=314280 RepID=Q1Z9Q3_9GAMM|nr:hypothetical protein P3TCK_05411 [Photobacterium profundum 3TCK]PSV63079.1 hypothetical protein C9J48_06220 [Photobacterium profundum]
MLPALAVNPFKSCFSVIETVTQTFRWVKCRVKWDVLHFCLLQNVIQIRTNMLGLNKWSYGSHELILKGEVGVSEWVVMGY